jgi:hypothetical protein
MNYFAASYEVSTMNTPILERSKLRGTNPNRDYNHRLRKQLPLAGLSIFLTSQDNAHTARALSTHQIKLLSTINNVSVLIGNQPSPKASTEEFQRRAPLVFAAVQEEAGLEDKTGAVLQPLQWWAFWEVCSLAIRPLDAFYCS